MTVSPLRKSNRTHPLRRRFNLGLHRWHRRIGVTTGVFLAWMAISGVLLNHTAVLDLAQRHLTSNFIATHYGIRSEIPAQLFIADQHWFIANDEAALLDGKKIKQKFSKPSGMVARDNILFVADVADLLLLDSTGELIDKVAAPIAIERIGLGCNGVVIANAEKQMVTIDGATFSECAGAVEWAHTENLSASKRAELTPLLRSGVTLERVLLDLHSGRFFGAWGPYVVDAVGLGAIVLAVSGILLFVRHQKLKIARH